MNWLTRTFGKLTLPRQARLPERQPEAITTMARASWEQPFGFVNPFFRIPVKENYRLLEQLVETVPIINAAVDRITQLVGCPKVESENQAAADDLMEWWENVRVNRTQVGGSNLFAGWNKSHLVYGRAHVEIIPSASLNDIFALQLLYTPSIFLRPRERRYGVDLIQDIGFGFGQGILLNDDLMLTAVHDIRDDNPNGCGLLYGMPFLAEIYNKMMISLKETWERYGVPIYHVNYEPSDEISDPDGTKGRAVIGSAMTGLSGALLAKANGQSKDFGSVGKVTVQILGAEGEVLDIETPGRQILENIVAKTGLPPWMLGLHWSTTERMSSVQASLLSELVSEIREHLAGEVKYLFSLRNALVGRPFEFEICWDAPSLIDQMESAQAAKAEADARAAALKVDERLWTLGILDAWQVAQRSRPDLEGKSQAEIEAMLPRLLAEPPLPVSPFGPGGQGQPGSEEEGRPLSSNGIFGRALTYSDNGNGRHG